MSNFALSDLQAQAILDLRLQRLTGLERDKIMEEHRETVESQGVEAVLLDLTLPHLSGAEVLRLIRTLRPEVPALLCADPERWNQLKAEPEGVNSPEWPIEQVRANEAAARAFWPLGNTRLEKRLPLIAAPTLLIWGAEDRIVPRRYADRFAAAIAGRTEITTIPGAGHLAELDKPDEVAAAILRWTS